jgi:hypothetical protein
MYVFEVGPVLFDAPLDPGFDCGGGGSARSASIIQSSLVTSFSIMALTSANCAPT